MWKRHGLERTAAAGRHRAITTAIETVEVPDRRIDRTCLCCSYRTQRRLRRRCFFRSSVFLYCFPVVLCFTLFTRAGSSLTPYVLPAASNIYSNDTYLVYDTDHYEQRKRVKRPGFLVEVLGLALAPKVSLDQPRAFKKVINSPAFP